VLRGALKCWCLNTSQPAGRPQLGEVGKERRRAVSSQALSALSGCHHRHRVAAETERQAMGGRWSTTQGLTTVQTHPSLPHCQIARNLIIVHVHISNTSNLCLDFEGRGKPVTI